MSLLTFKAHRSKIQMAKNFHSHNTEEHLKITSRSPLSNTKFGMRTFAYQASKIWNDLPNEYLSLLLLLLLLLLLFLYPITKVGMRTYCISLASLLIIWNDLPIMIIIIIIIIIIVIIITVKLKKNKEL